MALMTQPTTSHLELPPHYRALYRLFLRFAVVMLVFGGLAGVLFQELTSSVTYAQLAPGVRLEAFYHLALLHGHGFLIGTVMPLCWIVALNTALRLGAPPASAGALRWIIWTYLPGAISILGLITYKGLHYVQCIKGGETDFAAIHAGILGGNRLLRGIVYGLSHTVATVGLIIFAVVIWRGLNRSSERGT